jgi:hypothetical protein
MSSPAIATIVKMVESLPSDAQERLADHIRDYIAELDDEMRWNDSFKRTKTRGELVLFQQVVLCRDCPDQKRSIGDEAALLDFIPHPEGGEEGCILEIFDDVGRVAIVPISAVGVLRSEPEMRSTYDQRHLDVWNNVNRSI